MICMACLNEHFIFIEQNDWIIFLNVTRKYLREPFCLGWGINNNNTQERLHFGLCHRHSAPLLHSALPPSLPPSLPSFLPFASILCNMSVAVAVPLSAERKRAEIKDFSAGDAGAVPRTHSRPFQPPPVLSSSIVADPADSNGISPIYLTEKTLVKWNLKIGPDITDVVPYHVFTKEFIAKELADSGFMCDFYESRDIVKVPFYSPCCVRTEI
jgi:hypothetical protein